MFCALNSRLSLSCFTHILCPTYFESHSRSIISCLKKIEKVRKLSPSMHDRRLNEQKMEYEHLREFFCFRGQGDNLFCGLFHYKYS